MENTITNNRFIGCSGDGVELPEPVISHDKYYCGACGYAVIELHTNTATSIAKADILRVSLSPRKFPLWLRFWRWWG